MFKKNNLGVYSFLTFKIGEDMYAAYSDQVKNILDPYFYGFRNINRNEEIKIGNKAVKIILHNKSEKQHITNKTSIIMFSENKFGNVSNLGLFVDEVLALIEIDENQIISSPISIGNNLANYIDGAIQLDGKNCRILNVSKMLKEVCESNDKRKSIKSMANM